MSLPPSYTPLPGCKRTFPNIESKLKSGCYFSYKHSLGINTHRQACPKKCKPLKPISRSSGSLMFTNAIKPLPGKKRDYPQIESPVKKYINQPFESSSKFRLSKDFCKNHLSYVSKEDLSVRLFHDESSLSVSESDEFEFTDGDFEMNYPASEAQLWDDMNDLDDAFDFEPFALLGKGAFGAVFAAHTDASNETYAVKLVRIPPIGDPAFDLLKSELLILHQNLWIQCPFFLSLVTSFISEPYLCIVTERVTNGSLSDLRYRNFGNRLPEQLAHFYSAEIVAAVSWLHRLGIVHRDVTLSNFLITSCGHLKLCDFGMSVSVTATGNRPRYGNSMYMSPEMLTFATSGSFESDWWSVGVTVHYLLFGYHPYWHTMLTANGKAAQEPNRKAVEITELADITCKDSYSFIVGLLTYDPEDRLGHHGSDTVLRHPYIACFDREKLLRGKLDPPVIPTAPSLEAIPLKWENEFQRCDGRLAYRRATDEQKQLGYSELIYPPNFQFDSVL